MTAQQPPPAGAWARRFDNPWLLLIATMTMWGANGPVIRLATGEISPMTIVTLRWAMVGLAVLAFRPPSFARDWQAAKTKPLMLAALGVLMTISNGSIFVGAQFTTGINISILQGAGPVAVAIGAWLWFRTRIGPVRMLGLAVSATGILTLASKGDLSALLQVRLNTGDMLMLCSVAFYTVYILSLRFRPAMPHYSYFCFIALVSFAVSLPMLAAEMALGLWFWPTWKGLLALLYVAFFTSMLGQLFFMRAVELVGPGRAALFQNLAPVIGSVLSVILLGEEFAGYHLIALVFVIGGIWIAERLGGR